MRVPILLICASFATQLANAEPLTAADREALLENLEKIRKSAESTVDARFRLALGAYKNAMRSDEAAMELYLNCIEKVNFTDQQKKPGDFREWKRREAEKLSAPGLKLALRHQLRWLMLTLEAASEKAVPSKLAGEAQEIVDAIFRDSDKLGTQEAILNQPVTSTVFAQAYGINSVKVQEWPLSPVQLEEVYDQLLLPPFRNPSRLAELRATWVKYIQQENLKRDKWASKQAPAPEGGKKIGTIESLQSPEYLKFLAEDMPKLQWEMEMDLFKHGDESGAAVRMLAHLQKNIAHPQAREWGEDFQSLLDGKAPKGAAPAPTKPAATEDAPATPETAEKIPAGS